MNDSMIQHSAIQFVNTFSLSVSQYAYDYIDLFIVNDFDLDCYKSNTVTIDMCVYSLDYKGQLFPTHSTDQEEHYGTSSQ